MASNCRAVLPIASQKYCERSLTPHGMSPMPRSTQTWVFQLFKKSSTAEVPSTEHDYNPTRTRYFNPFHGILSYAVWNDGGQLTYNMVHEISSLEGTSLHQAVYRLDSCQHICLWTTLYCDFWFDTIKKRFINNSNQLIMFRAMISSIFRSTRLCTIGL
jgi:hypothetical protein